MRGKAMALLARREHGRRELRDKLCSKGFDAALVEGVIAELIAKGLQSDRRYAEAYIHSRRQRGEGPLRIQVALQQRGIDEELISPFLQPHDPDWARLARQVRNKRFGRSPPRDARERLRQERFLRYRGFTSAQLKSAFAAEAVSDIDE